MTNDDAPPVEAAVSTKNVPKKKPKLQVSAREYDDISSTLLLGLKQLDETDTYDENIISVNRCTHSLTYYALTDLLTHLLTHSLTSSLTYSLTYLLNHLLTYLLTHLLTQLLTHSLTHTIQWQCSKRCAVERFESVVLEADRR